MRPYQDSNLVQLPPNPKVLLDELGVPAEDVFAVAAIRAMFNEIGIHQNGVTRTIRDRETYCASKEEIEYRYIMFKTYYNDFFRGEPQDSMSERDATIVATIGNSLLPDIGKLAIFNKHIPTPQRRLTRDALNAAHGIWDEAIELGLGLISKECPPTRSALFLAHINALYDIAEIQTHFEDITLDELQTRLRDTILPAFSFVDYTTAIGRKLNEDLIDGEQAIIALFPKAESIQAVAPTIVHPWQFTRKQLPTLDAL